MRRCLDEGDVPALHNAVSLWVPDSVRFSLLTIAGHLPFPGRGVELSRVLYTPEGSGFDDAKVREVGFLAVNSWIVPAFKQYSRNSSLVYSPPLSAHQRTMRPPKGMTVEPTNS